MMTNKKWYYDVTIGIYDEETGVLINEFSEGDLRDEVACLIDTDVKKLMEVQDDIQSL
jgi:hypothetical protein